MTKRKEHHIVPISEGIWGVKKSDGEKSIKNFDKKADAESFGRKVSQNQGSELVIHGKDGRIQRSDSHGPDPHPPKDKK